MVNDIVLYCCCCCYCYSFSFSSFIYLCALWCGFAWHVILYFFSSLFCGIHTNSVRHLAVAAAATKCQSTRITRFFSTAVWFVLIWRFQLNLLHSHNLLQLWTPFSHSTQCIIIYCVRNLCHTLPIFLRCSIEIRSEDVYFIRYKCILHCTYANFHRKYCRNAAYAVYSEIFFFFIVRTKLKLTKINHVKWKTNMIAEQREKEMRRDVVNFKA